MKKAKPEFDLSPEAVAQRMNDLRDLYELAQSLSHAKVLGPVSEYPIRSGARASNVDQKADTEE